MSDSKLGLAVQEQELPPESLLQPYRARGAFTDCYCLDLPGNISHAQYVYAFYTTRLFKLERFILKYGFGRGSTDSAAKRLAEGADTRFAAWHVEGRAQQQLLLADFKGRTRSWLMVQAPSPAMPSGTRLYFGSAVVPQHQKSGEQPQWPAGFRALLSFHKLYSRMLLRAAARKLTRSN